MFGLIGLVIFLGFAAVAVIAYLACKIIVGAFNIVFSILGGGK